MIPKNTKSPLAPRLTCTLFIAATFPMLAVASEPSVWPKSGLAAFVFQHLDLTTFRNSTGPRRKSGQRSFADLGIKPTHASETMVVSASDEWTYSIEVLARRDFNRDAVEEVAICFTDKAGMGTYNTQQPLLLQMFDGRAVAIAYDISTDSDAAKCKNSR